MRTMLILWGSLAIFGCSSSDGGGEPDAAITDDAAADGPQQDQAAPDKATDTAVDIGSADVSPDVVIDSAPLPTFSEQEPNNGANDDYNTITLPTMVTGAIGEANDADLFAFSASAGDRLRFEITSDGPLQPHLAIFGLPPLDVPLVVNKASGDLVVELYAIKDGTYLLGVRDQRNVADPPAGVGDPSFTYSVAIEPLARAPLAATVGVVVESKLEPAGVVRVFSFDALEDDDLTIKVIAQKLSPPSDVDSRLTLFSPAQSAWLGTNDDASLSEKDSLLEGTMPFTGTYHVIVENIADSGSDFRFALEITKNN